MALRLSVAAVALVCALAVPLRLSDDAWAYAAYGALLVHGIDPWAHAVTTAGIAPLHDPVLDTALARWGGSLPRDVYGPFFTVPCAALVALLAPLGAAAPVTALRLAAALGLLACIALAQRTRPRLASLLAFHPVALWSAAEGHNDTLWLALALALAASRSRVPLRWLAAAAAVKAIAVVPLAWSARAAPRRDRILAAVAVAAAYAPLAWSVISGGLDRGGGAPRISLAHAAALAVWSGSALPLFGAIVCAVLGGVVVVSAWRAGERMPAAALAAWLALPAPEPWYALWLLPIVALAVPGRAGTALFAATFTGTLLYVQDALPGTVLHGGALLGGIMLAVYALPLLLALQVTPAPAPSPLPEPSPAPVPTATTTPSPPPASPSPSPSPSPSGSPSLFGYVVTPTPGPSPGPQILEVAANDKVQHEGGNLLVRVRTSPDVVQVMLRAMGRQIALPQAGPGVFGAQQQLPTGIPFFFLNRWYDVAITATDGNGRSMTTVVPLRLEH